MGYVVCAPGGKSGRSREKQTYSKPTKQNELRRMP